MPVSFAIGNRLVTPDNLMELRAMGDLEPLFRRGKGAASAAFSVSGKEITRKAIDSSFRTVRAKLTKGFTPIGLGKPLSIEILTIYTGDAPSRGLLGKIFGGKPDFLVASAVKDLVTFDAAPRAINRLDENVKDKEHLRPSATVAGSPIVYYVPALTTGTLFTSYELVVDSFDKGAVNALGGMFKLAAGLPVFAPASVYLLAGSFLTKIAGKVGEALLETRPYLKADLDLRFDSPIIPSSLAWALAIYNDRDKKPLESYEVRVVGQKGRYRVTLVDPQSKKEYSGDAPYIIVSIDGQTRKDLNDFQAKLASAALLDRFYASGDVGGQAVGAIEDALSLYNDLKFRRKAEDAAEELKGLNKNTKEYKAKKELLDAYRANIKEDLLKLDDPVP